MKTLWLAVLCVLCETACDRPPAPSEAATAATPSTELAAAPAEAPHPPADPTNIVSIAGGSKDHSTLVAALKAADYLDAVANPGPFTVFAPTNAAFDKLPKGTVESLVQPAKQADLRGILQHHVTVSTYAPKDLHDGQVLSMVDGGKVTVHVRNGKIAINDANVVASLPASNGMVHVIDAVLLPVAK
jgi:uncharacterized surface protein with fasciclin (FAS1) repeats